MDGLVWLIIITISSLFLYEIFKFYLLIYSLDSTQLIRYLLLVTALPDKWRYWFCTNIIIYW